MLPDNMLAEMRKEVIDISEGSPTEIVLCTQIIHDNGMYMAEPSGEIYEDRRQWGYIRFSTQDDTWCSYRESILYPITLKDFLVKYGKPKYSLGDLYLR